ncbi:targeting protein for Xklp2 isoform X1 [Gadus macrocephalus]|uniref:targeting protein for Xklp2 isoform X1 n=1 Tax=Gadus macrocephalus TaxID=80720 RepID=UPI0028CB373A|nr:targeting protein for Xklp2 isoform X1 [Gadus macrocephalus]
MEQDHSWEYDAPSHVVDFKDLDGADTSDHWFEQRASGSEAQLATPLGSGQHFGGASKGNLPKAIVCPYVEAEVDPEPSADAAPPSNIITSWGPRQAPNRNAARGPAARTRTNPSAQPRRVSKRKEASAAAETTSAPVESASAVVVPPVKKQKSMLSTEFVRQQTLRRRSSAGRTAPRLSGSLRRSCRRPTAATSSPLPNSTEALELERIKTLQSEVAAHRRHNEASYKAALAGDHLPKRLVLSTTIPKEFHFSTDSRVRPSSSTASDQGNFQAQLRKHPSSPSKGPKGATVPRPFNLSAGSKRRAEDATTQPYVPIAEQIAAFQRRTPDRYHLRSRQMQGRGPSQVKGEHLKITQPHTPQLMTRQRSRPTLMKSHTELEDEEVERMQKFQFKALELNRKILEGALNPKKPAAKEPTRTQGFELQVEQRLQQRQAGRKPEEEEKPVVFHPRPLPTRLLAEVVGVPDKKVAHPTVPESPAFALKKRVRLEPKAEEVKPPSPIRAHPVPHFGLPFQPRLPEKSQVESCPFSFDVREQESRVLKEKKLEMLRNEEVPKFKAQPLPDFHEVNLPERKVLLSTKPEPFRLRVDERGGVKTDRWDKMVKEEQKRQVEATTFKARPNTVIHKEPFQPKKENRCAADDTNHSAVPEAFQLSTERRAVERQEFERAAVEKEALRARMEEEQRRLEEVREVEEVARMRHEQVHKAQPVRKYKPVEVRKCDTALTVPQSPKFSDRFHL